MILAPVVDFSGARRWTSVAVVLGILFTVVPAAGQSKPSKPGKPAAPAPATQPSPAKVQARSYQVAGNRYANAGRWDDAYAEYAIAWQLVPDWQSAADLGKAAYRTKHWTIAARRLAFYLREAPPGRVSAKERAAVQKWLAEATGKSGSLTIVAPAGAEISIDGEAVGKAPLPGPVAVDPGKHDIEARAGSLAESKTTALLAGETRELRLVALVGPGGSESNAGAGRGSALRPVAVVSGAALTVGGIVAGSVFLAMAAERGADKQKAALDVNGRETATRFAAAEAEARNGALWGFVGAGLCAAGTAVLYFTAPSPEKVPVKAAFGVRDGGPAIVVQGQF